MRMFLDCGANVGQAYTYFNGKYGDSCNYVLFEPNPNCYKELKKQFGNASNVEIHNKAVYISDCVKPFRFETDYSVGGSIIKNHNSAYGVKGGTTVEVECVNIIEIVENLSRENSIIIKLDVESSEYDILECMISSKTIFKVEKIYCEFHSQYMNKEDKKVFKEREDKIMNFVRDNGISFELWH